VDSSRWYWISRSDWFTSHQYLHHDSLCLSSMGKTLHLTLKRIAFFRDWERLRLMLEECDLMHLMQELWTLGQANERSVAGDVIVQERINLLKGGPGQIKPNFLQISA